MSFVLVNVKDVYLYLSALRHPTVLFKDYADNLSLLSASLHSLPQEPQDTHCAFGFAKVPNDLC